jgi:hypothetical protein
MVCVAVRDDKSAQIPNGNLQDIQVAGKSGSRQTAVVEDRTPTTTGLDGDQRREAMLCDQLAAVAEVASKVPADAIGAGHQYVDEVVDDDRDFGMIDRL